MQQVVITTKEEATDATNLLVSSPSVVDSDNRRLTGSQTAVRPVSLIDGYTLRSSSVFSAWLISVTIIAFMLIAVPTSPLSILGLVVISVHVACSFLVLALQAKTLRETGALPQVNTYIAFLPILIAGGTIVAEAILAEVATDIYEGEYNDEARSVYNYIKRKWNGPATSEAAKRVVDNCDDPQQVSTRDKLVRSMVAGTLNTISSSLASLRRRTKLDFSARYNPSYLWTVLQQSGPARAPITGKIITDFLKGTASAIAANGASGLFRMLGRSLCIDMTVNGKRGTINSNVWWHMYSGFMSNFDKFLVSPYAGRDFAGTSGHLLRHRDSLRAVPVSPYLDDFTEEHYEWLKGEATRLILLAHPDNGGAVLPAHIYIALTLFYLGTNPSAFSNSDAKRAIESVYRSLEDAFRSTFGNSEAAAFFNLLKSTEPGNIDLVQIPEFNGSHVDARTAFLLVQEKLCFYGFR